MEKFIKETEKEIVEPTYGVFSFILEMGLGLIALLGKAINMGRKSRGSVIQF